jgi:trigger factor
LIATAAGRFFCSYRLQVNAMSSADTDVTSGTENEAAEERAKLKLEVKVDKPSACERHVLVTVPRDDIERYYTETFDELVPKAELPGFRAGKAPRRLVEKQFRERVADQVKGKLLMDSMAQVSEECDFSAISEPDFDFEAVVLPEEGPMKFEFNIEVRPEFDLPEWKNLNLEKPAHEYGDVDIDRNLQRILAKHGQLVPVDGEAKAGDHLVVSVVFTKDGETVSTLSEETVELKKTLSFADAKIENFDKLMTGVKAGESRTANVTVSDDAEEESLRGQTVSAEFQVLDVKRLELPELTHAFLDRIGGFEDEDELRDEVRKELERQLDYHQQQKLRQQITAELTKTANWELPEKLLQRQFRRELDRAVMELRAAGFPDDVIQQHANQLRQNSRRNTEMALKEHFILERIAEENKIEAEPGDYDDEIRKIAAQSGESARRVRSRMEKRGQIDTLRNQIVERKVINLITEHATIKDVPLELPSNDTVAVDFAIGEKREANIPEAKPGGEEQPIPGMEKK